MVVEVGEAVPPDASAVGVPVVAGPAGPELLTTSGWTAGFEDVAAGGGRAPLDRGWLARQGFTGKVGQALAFRGPSGGPVRLLLGLGDRAGLNAERGRRASAALVIAGLAAKGSTQVNIRSGP